MLSERACYVSVILAHGGCSQAFKLDRDKQAFLYFFKPDRTTANVKPDSLLTLTQHAPSFETVLMLDSSSSNNTIFRYGIPVAAEIFCKAARGEANGIYGDQIP